MVDASARFIVHRPWIARRSRIYADINIKALPDGGAPITIAYINVSARIRLFFSLISFSINIDLLNSQSPANTLPWDAIPGGTQPIKDNLPNNIPTHFEQFIALESFSGTLKADVFLANNFCFVPIVSALDITTITRPSLNAVYVGGASPGNPSRLVNFIAQEPRTVSGQTFFNITHPSFTARNAEWLLNEMEGIIPNDLNCSNQCAPTGFIINGAAALCGNTENYIFQSIPLNSNINWSVSPSGIVTLVTNSDKSVTLTKIANGVITLTGNITVCGQTISATKQIKVGVPEPPIIFASNYDAQCGTFFEAYCTETNGATGYRWDINLGQFVQDQSGNFTNYVYVAPLINTPETGQQYYNYVSVQARNACGLSEPSSVLQFTVGPVPSNCGNGGPILLRVSPNPTTGSMMVETTDGSPFSQLRIFNKMGELKKEFSFPGTKKLTINISDLPANIYNIRVRVNNNWRTLSFIKQ